jgi:hypothetical protein
MNEILIAKTQNTVSLKQYDLEERTIGNIEDGKQLVRSSGSCHANYIEANEALSREGLSFGLKKFLISN